MDSKAKELIRQEKEKRRLEREQKKKEQLKRADLEKTEKISIHGSKDQHSSPPLQLNVIKNAPIPNDIKDVTQSLNYGEGYLLKNRTAEPSAPTNKESPNRNLRNQFEIYTSNIQKGSEDEKDLEKKIKKQKYSNYNNAINELENTSDFISEKQRSDILRPQNGDVHYIHKIGNGEEKVTYEVDQLIDPNIRVDEDIIENKETVEEIYELIESDNEDDINDLRVLKNKDTPVKNRKKDVIFNKRTEDIISDVENSNLHMEQEEEQLNKKFITNMKDFMINKEAENVENDLMKEKLSYSDFEIVRIMDPEKFDECFQDYSDNIENRIQNHSAYYEEIEYLLQLLKDKKKKLVGNLCDDEEKKEVKKPTEEDILDELETFHKNVNNDIDKNKEKWNAKDNETTKEKEKTSIYNIDRIYEELGIQKKEEKEVIGFSLIENEEEIKDEKKNRKEKENNKDKANIDRISEKKDVHLLPKGFFDDKEKKEFLKTHSDLEKIDEQIQFLENEKKILLQEYENFDFVYNEKINNYIDYLYDDEYENNEVIIQKIKKKEYKDYTKNKHVHLIEKMLTNKKKKKYQREIKK